MTKSIIRSAVGVAVLGMAGITSVSAAQPDPFSPKTSPGLFELHSAAAKAVESGNCAEAQAKSQQILASGNKKPDDVYAAHSFVMRCASARKDMAALIPAIEGMLSSGFNMGPAQVQLKKGLTSSYYQQKNYQKTIEHGTDLMRSGAADENIVTVVGQSYYQTKQYGEAVKLFGGRVEAAEKSGRKPDRSELSLLQAAYANSGNDQGAQATLEKLVRYYPEAQTWMILLYDVKKEKLDPRQRLFTYRLMEATGNLKAQGDYVEYSGAAMSLGLLNEANRVLQKGVDAKAFTQQAEADRAQRYLKSNADRMDEVRADVAKFETEAKTGDEFVTLGMLQHNFDQYPKAVAALKSGIGKGGLRNAADAQLALGIAQLKAGQKSDAAATFRGIKTDNATTQRIAKLWALYASS